MDEDALRALVRQAVAKYVQGGVSVPASEARPMTFAGHVSHVRYVLPETDGPCLI